MEQLMKESVAIRFPQLPEHVASSVGESRPEPQDLLKLLLRLNLYHVT